MKYQESVKIDAEVQSGVVCLIVESGSEKQTIPMKQEAWTVLLDKIDGLRA